MFSDSLKQYDGSCLVELPCIGYICKEMGKD